MRGLTFKRNFAWHLTGNVAYSVAQWLLLVILANLADSETVGQFALLLAITAPIFLSFGMKLRTAQATDVGSEFNRGEYRRLRHVLNICGTLVSVAVGIVAGQTEVLVALIGLCVAKSSEGLSQTDYGFFQRSERMDVVSRSLLVRSVLGPLGFILGLAVTDGLAGATWGLACGWIVVQLVMDNRAGRRMEHRLLGAEHRRQPLKARRVFALARQCAPLGADAGVSSLGVNAPRYAIDAYLGAASLGIFASSAYLTQTVSMVSSSMASVLLPRLARAYRSGRRTEYLSVVWKLVMFGIGVTGIATLAAHLFGEPLLRFLLGEAYAKPQLLMALMVSAGATTVHRMLCKGLEASRRFAAYLIVDTITTVAIVIAALFAVPRWGLLGGAYALTAGFALGAILALLVLLQSAYRLNRYTAPA